MKECKYIAIKVEDFNHWLWFKAEKVTEKNGRFIGLAGWGLNGNYTEIDIEIGFIEGRIHSDHPQYR